MNDSKDPSVHDLLSRLNLQEYGWRVVDHWPADRYAIGIVSSSTPGRLFYICTFQTGDGRFDYEAEIQAESEPLGYSVYATGQGVTFIELRRALNAFLCSSGGDS